MIGDDDLKAIRDAFIATVTGRLPSVMIMSGSIILQIRPDLADLISPYRAYRVTREGITEMEDEDE